jgi:tRNA nucleotidyltransferase (CCA-adding enzyme)
MTDVDQLAAVAAAVPAHVREVCARLADAKFEAVTVGGAVRDALLGRSPGDWDVATSARPEEVMKQFRHTIATGLQHGTVTVVMGKGVASHVEVTTYRGEGAYSDARRPDHVVFGVPLVEDLQRRDLVVNAIAYDPVKNVLIDPFGGRADLAARRLRAVGDPVARFTEDGLRVMRVMRFAAQLEFDVDPETEAAIGVALPSLARVSRERVCEELRKTLDAPQPSRGLAIARRSGILKTVLADLDAAITDEQQWLDSIDRAPARARLGALMAPLADPAADGYHLDFDTQKRVAGVLRALKFSNVEADLAATLVATSRASREEAWTPTNVRRLLAAIDRDKRLPAIELWAADPHPNAALIAEARRILAAKEPLAIGDLVLTGKDLMAALSQPPGPIIGRILQALLDRVIEDPSLNTRDRLLAAAQELELDLGRA